MSDGQFLRKVDAALVSPPGEGVSMGPSARQGRWMGKGVEAATAIPWGNPEIRGSVRFGDDPL